MEKGDPVCARSVRSGEPTEARASRTCAGSPSASRVRELQPTGHSRLPYPVGCRYYDTTMLRLFLMLCCELIR